MRSKEFFLVAALAAGLAVSGWVIAGGANAKQAPIAPRDLSVALAADDLKERFGVKMDQVRLSAAGRMLDLRYRVLDAEKARRFIKRNSKPFLVHNASGTRLTTPSFPKVGALRQSGEQLKEGRVYFVLFANPSGMVKPGDTLTMVVDEHRVGGISVH